MKIASLLIASTLLVAAPALAAEDDAVATLRVQSGDVKVSTGGDFGLVNTGVRFHGGNRLMLAEGARAVVRYDNDCEEEYTKPGVYTIDDECLVGPLPAGADWVGASSIASGALVGAALLNSMDKKPGPPASR